MDQKFCEECQGEGKIPIGEHHVTPEMACDAGDPTLEGSLFEIEYAKCEACGGNGFLDSETPEERAAKELEEELGFRIRRCEEPDCIFVDAVDKRGAHSHWPSASFSLWFLALRQRVELNKLNESK